MSSVAAARASKRARAQQALFKKFTAVPLTRGEWLKARWDLVFIVQRRNLLLQHPDAPGHAAEILSLEIEHDKLLDRLGTVEGICLGDTVPTKWVI